MISLFIHRWLLFYPSTLFNFLSEWGRTRRRLISRVNERSRTNWEHHWHPKSNNWEHHKPPLFYERWMIFPSSKSLQICSPPPPSFQLFSIPLILVLPLSLSLFLSLSRFIQKQLLNRTKYSWRIYGHLANGTRYTLTTIILLRVFSSHALLFNYSELYVDKLIEIRLITEKMDLLSLNLFIVLT